MTASIRSFSNVHKGYGVHLSVASFPKVLNRTFVCIRQLLLNRMGQTRETSPVLLSHLYESIILLIHRIYRPNNKKKSFNIGQTSLDDHIDEGRCR